VKSRIEAVLFDLDGTLIDSAPDLAGAANDLRVQHGLAPLPYGDLRPMAGAGARGMVGVAFGAQPGDPRFNDLREAFLARYEQRLLQETVVFASVLPVLAALDVAAMRWGIVTNKVMRFTHPVVAGLGLQTRAAALIGGDSTAHAKPHPEPLLEAARRIGVEPGRCVYVGDDLRDVQAGRAAGMVTLAAGWGYLGQGEAIEQWGANAVIHEPAALLNWLGLA
jgi:N-acetyl-D-muramate 6-phosphate phosphatase